MLNRETLIDQQKKLKAFLKAYDELVDSFYEFDEAVNSDKAVAAYPLNESFDEIYFKDWADAVLDKLYKLAWNDERFRENTLEKFLSKKLGKEVKLQESDEPEYLSFGRMSKVADKGADFSKIFDEETYDDAHYFAISKETFSYEEDGLNFKYKYVIEQTNWDNAYKAGEISEATYESFDDKIETMISIVPTPESLTEDMAESVASCGGLDTDEITVRDIYDYGASIQFDYDTCSPAEADKKLLAIANGFPQFEGLFGFYMDRPQNRIGDDGWDKIKEWIKESDDEQPIDGNEIDE